MDNRLVLTVLLVTLSWLSVGTYAQGNNMTTAPGNMTTAPGNITTAPGNMTTAPGNMTTAPGNNMTTAPGNMTTAPGNMTTAPGNMTTAPGNNMTTAPGNMTTAPGNNMTTAPGNMTTAPGNMTTAPGNNMTTAPGNMTTAPGNMTTAPGNNMTTAPGNMTTAPGNMTTAPGNNMTTGPVTTVAPAAPPLTPNITVENLETTINNTGCGTEQLCAAEPASCDPAVAGSCFFLSARQTSGQNFEFGLSGEADGYIAATLSSDNTLGGNDTTYVCANNNSVVAFFTAVLNDSVLTLTVLNVNNVRGRVDGNRIQCTFAATVPDSASATSRSTRASSLALTISTGPFNSTSGALGAPTPRLQSPVVNLANPNTTIGNQISNTTNATTASPTTMTTQAGNTTAAPVNTTAAPVNTTAAPVNITTAPVTLNIPVENLETPLNRTGCGTEQLCAAEPASCDPAVAGSCFFLSARQTSGPNFDCGLSGQSDGYIAATLSSDSTLGGNDATYVCANNNGTVAFFSAFLNNNMLTLTALNVSNVRGRVDGNTIQCTFGAIVPDPATSVSTRASNVTIAISTGAFNSASGALGAPTTRLQSLVGNLANPMNVVNQATNDTATTVPPTTSSPAMTTGHAITLQQSLTHAMLIAASVLGLFML